MPTAYNPHLGDAEEFLKKHLRLATYVSNRFRASFALYHVDIEEIEAIARVGLVRAYRQFDPAKAQWSTYAMLCMQTELLEELRKLRRYKRVHSTTSLNAPVKGVNEDIDKVVELLDLIEAEQSLEEQMAQVSIAVHKFSERNQQIALLAASGWKQADIARKYGISGARVGRILARIRKDF
jgi:RNA polymerase sigma factor (sigma-70 family)